MSRFKRQCVDCGKFTNEEGGVCRMCQQSRLYKYQQELKKKKIKSIYEDPYFFYNFITGQR
jgi:hypothetical protein